MTTPNPFAQNQHPQQPAAPAAPAPAAQPSPFGSVPQVPQAAPAQPNPFPAPAPAAAQPNPFPPQQQYAAPAPAQQQWQQPAAQAPQAAAPAPAAQAGAFDMSRGGAAGAPEASGGKGPDLAAMYGRLVVLFPLREETVPRRPEHITAEQRAAGNIYQQKMTATVVVLDRGPGHGPGGTIEWGGRPHGFPPVPHTNSDPLPYIRKSMWINQTQLIGQARPYMPQTPGGAPGWVAGRVTKAGPAQNDPWYLATPTEQELALVQTYLTLVTQGTYPHPLAP